MLLIWLLYIWMIVGEVIHAEEFVTASSSSSPSNKIGTDNASNNNCIDILNELKAKDVYYCDNDNLLIKASYLGDLEGVRCALKEDEIDIKVTDGFGKTALIWASYAGKLDIVKFLIDKGADVNHVDNDGKTALIWASLNGKWDDVKFLVDKGADVDHADKDGWTALMRFSHERKWDVVKFLVENGADVAIQDKDGKTALDHAEERGYTNIPDLLRQYENKEKRQSSLNPITTVAVLLSACLFIASQYHSGLAHQSTTTTPLWSRLGEQIQNWWPCGGSNNNDLGSGHKLHKYTSIEMPKM